MEYMQLSIKYLPKSEMTTNLQPTLVTVPILVMPAQVSHTIQLVIAMVISLSQLELTSDYNIEFTTARYYGTRNL